MTPASKAGPMDSKTETAPPTAPLAVPDRFESLAQMKESHRGLLRLRRSDGTSFESQVRRFRSAGIALGAMLDLPGDREAAQSMLDYWTSMNALAGASDEPAILAPFDEKRVGDVVESIEREVAGLSRERQTLARRILVHLVKLNDDGKTVTLAPAPRSALEALGDKAEVQVVLDALLKSGAIKLDDAAPGDAAPGDTGAGEPHYRLAGESLLRTWGRLGEWWKSRISLRKAAEFWKQRGRDVSALFGSGLLLEEARAYRDLGGVEREFADASNQLATQRTKVRNRFLTALVGVLALLLVLSVSLILIYRDAGHAHRRAKTAAEEAALQAKKHAQELADVNKRLAIKNDELEKAIEAIQHALADKDQALQEAEKNANLARQRSDSLEKLLKGAANLEDLAEKLQKELPKSAQLIVQPYLKKYKTAVDKVLVDMSGKVPDSARLKARPLRPGVSVSVLGSHGFGSVCCFVRDRQGQRYLVVPRFVLDAKPGTPVVQPGGGAVAGRAARQEDVVGLVHEFPAQSGNDLLNVAFARLNPDIAATNKAERIAIAGLASEIMPGTPVTLFGACSGVKTGKVLRTNPRTGEIITTRMSCPGDAGGAVLTADGKLVGMLALVQNDENTIVPIAAALKRLDLQLLAE